MDAGLRRHDGVALTWRVNLSASWYYVMAAQLPTADRAILDIRKLEDYCLSPSHPRGGHKARVFRDALGLDQGDAAWLRAALLAAAATGEAVPLTTDAWRTVLAARRRHQATAEARGGKNIVD